MPPSERLPFAFRSHWGHNIVMSDTVEQVKQRLSILDVVSSYVKLERAGQNMRAKCPFHAERTPSFFVSPERGTYHCFGCDKGGDIFSFVQDIEGIDFKGALKILAERAGVPLRYSKREKGDDRDRLHEIMEAAAIFYASRLTKEAHEYLQKRGLSENTIGAFRLGYAGDGWGDACDYLQARKFSEKELLDAGISKRGERGIADKFRNRIMFPIADSAGRIIAFSGRTFGEKAHPDAPKYLNSPETTLFKKSHILYGFDRAKHAMRKHNFAILVEGQMDLLLSHETGFANTIAVSGTACTEEHARLLKRMTDNLVIALDADEAGVKAAGRAARVALREGLHVKVAALPRGSDPADMIAGKGKDAWRAIVRDSKDVITFFLNAIEERAKDAERFRRSVESAVLPFLNDVRSPLEREHYMREIAGRLHVSESAVAEATARLPRESAMENFSTNTSGVHVRQLPKRAEEAYAILVWQKSVSKPAIDCDQYEEALEQAVGRDMFNDLKSIPKDRLEALRFKVEEHHRNTEAALQKSVKSLLEALLRTRHSEELKNITQKLAMAEECGDEGLTQQLLKQSKDLTKCIAELGNVV